MADSKHSPRIAGRAGNIVFLLSPEVRKKRPSAMDRRLRALINQLTHEELELAFAKVCELSASRRRADVQDLDQHRRDRQSLDVHPYHQTEE